MLSVVNKLFIYQRSEMIDKQGRHPYADGDNVP